MKLTTKRLCRAGVVAALYTALTLLFSPVAFGPLQVRPSEALTALPLLFPETIPALFVGCLLSNLLSPYGVADLVVGSLLTLAAAFLTRLCRKKPLIALSFPVLLNALGLPILWLFMGGESAFFLNFCSIFLTQAVFIYGLGYPLYRSIKRLQGKYAFLQ